MTKLAWNAVGERVFEAGVDRGVLYVGNLPGVPWNGLVSVKESPVGGEITPYYIDGIKYLNSVASEEYSATVEAFTYPDEFEVCQGIVATTSGLLVTSQKKKSFGLSYRSLVGNDVDEIDHGYKIHLVYNALIEPAEVEHNTLAETTSPDNFSWKIVTKPDDFEGFRPTAHFIIDSRKTTDTLLAFVEDILYGTDTQDPRMPSSDELVYIFLASGSVIIDGGDTIDEEYAVFDAGTLYDTETVAVDGGGP